MQCKPIKSCASIGLHYNSICDFSKLKQKVAFSLIEMMFALVALSVLLSAFAPVLSRQVELHTKSASASTVIKTDVCRTEINAFCNLCDMSTKKCLSCELTQSSCSSGQTLNYDKCACE